MDGSLNTPQFNFADPGIPKNRTNVPNFGIGRIQPQARFQPMTGAQAFMRPEGQTGFGALRFLNGQGFTPQDLNPPRVDFLPGGIFGARNVSGRNIGNPNIRGPMRLR